MPQEIAAWRRTLPAGSAYGIVSAFQQVCEAGVRWRRMATNPVRSSGPNRQPRRTEIVPLERSSVDAIAAELAALYGALVVFAAETALRPAEWLALEQRDVQTALRVCIVERALGPARREAVRKDRREPPLRAAHPPRRRCTRAGPRRTDPRNASPSSLVFPDSKGGHLA